MEYVSNLQFSGSCRRRCASSRRAAGREATDASSTRSERPLRRWPAALRCGAAPPGAATRSHPTAWRRAVRCRPRALADAAGGTTTPRGGACRGPTRTEPLLNDTFHPSRCAKRNKAQNRDRSVPKSANAVTSVTSSSLGHAARLTQTYAATFVAPARGATRSRNFWVQSVEDVCLTGHDAA